MINYDSLTLKIFKDENINFFIGAKIQKIQQPSRSELIFFMRNNKESKKFYINFNPQFYHICFMSDDNEKKRFLTIPKTAPMFCMLLRKYILNAKIIKVDVPKYERIFEIYFEYYDELNEKSCLCLSVELMGKYSNVILYNYDTNVIIGCAHNVSSEKSRDRELAGLLPYTYPAKQKKKNLLNSSFDSFKQNIDIHNIVPSLSNCYYYLTMPIAFRLNSCSNNLEELYQNLIKYLSLQNYKPSITKDYSEFFLSESSDSIRFGTVNEMIDSYFSFHQSKFIVENLKSKIYKCINTQIKKLNSLKEKQVYQIERFNKALEYKNKADIIMANLYNLKNMQKEQILYDFSGNEIKIDMDINISAVENANKYYSLYKKTKTSYEHALEMIEDTKSQILFYEEQNFYAQNTADVENLQEILFELKGEESKNKIHEVKIDFIEFENYKIFIGKNKKQNDYILSKLASSEDLWFHPLNIAGAHILVKVNNKSQVPDSVLLKAALLTKEYSSQKNNSKTSIIYTKRKYVKKANKKLAFVTYKNETEIIV